MNQMRLRGAAPERYEPNRQPREDLSHLTAEELALRTFMAEQLTLHNMVNFGTPNSPLAEYDARWDGGTHAASGRTFGNFWERLMSLCAAREINPCEYILWRLRTWNEHTFPATRHFEATNQLMNFERRALPSTEEFALALESLHRQATHEIWRYQNILGLTAPGDAERALVARNDANLSPLYRYCFAVQHRFETVAAALFPHAVCDYMQSRNLFDAVWGDFLPPHLRTATATQLLMWGQGRNV